MSLADAAAAWDASRPVRPKLRLVESTFPEARGFIEDLARFKWAMCTRRSAKSYSVGLEFVESLLEKGGKHLIIGLTYDSVRGAFWDDVLKAIDRKFGLKLSFNETRLEVRNPVNGGIIRLLGMDASEDEKRKALGQKYRKINVDEAQAFKTDLEQLVYKTLGPATADLGGTISLTGTPGNLTRGLFYEVTTGKRTGWSGHRWTTHQNTAIPEGETVRMCDRWAEQIAALKAHNDRVVETPWFRQEYLGEWVIESDKLVYRYLEGRNDFDGVLPEYKTGAWHYGLGCDLGYNDPTAWVVDAYHDHDPRLFRLMAQKEKGLDVTGVARRTKAIIGAYAAKGIDFEWMVIDNANKQAVEELKRRHSLPWIAADKTGKADFIEIMNSEMIMGHILLGPGCDKLREEYGGLIWDEKSLERGKREEHPACPNHCADAGLYSWRKAYAYLSERPKAPPPEGSPEWEASEEDRLAERLQAEAEED